MAIFNYVKDANLRFTTTPTRRKKTEGIVIHHPAQFTTSPEDIHRYHLNRGWIGAGYNFLIMKSGVIWELRPHWAIGAHAGSKVSGVGLRNNSYTIGMCFEGYYHPRNSGDFDTDMPKAQFDAGVKLINDLKTYYNEISWINGHREMPGASTVCPGQFFPLEDIRRAVGLPISSESKQALLKRGMTGSEVEKLQQKLKVLGYYKDEIDGIFGPNTERAVKDFQTDQNIAVDGIVGPDTRNNIESEISKQSQNNSNVDELIEENNRLKLLIVDLRERLLVAQDYLNE